MYNSEVRNKLYGYFTQSMGFKNYNKGWLKGDCPDCGKHGKFGIQLFKNRSNCFVCGYNDKPILIVMKNEGFETKNEALNFLNIFNGQEYLDLKALEKGNDISKPDKVSIKLPEHFRLITFGRNQLARSARNYLRSRGFNIPNLALRGIGFCDRGPYLGHIIFPFYMGGNLVYFQARQFIELGSKFKNPSMESFGIGKSVLMYNVDSLAIYRKIYLVESVTNSLTLGPRAVAIMGKFLSNYQFSMILRSPVEEVVIFLDPDACKNAIELAMKLIPFKKVKLILGEGNSDVNDLGKDKALEIIKNTPYSHYQQLLKLKHIYNA